MINKKREKQAPAKSLLLSPIIETWAFRDLNPGHITTLAN